MVFNQRIANFGMSKKWRSSAWMIAMVFLLLGTCASAFPEMSVDLNLLWEPELGTFINSLRQKSEAQRQKTVRRSSSSTRQTQTTTSSLERTASLLPFLPFASGAELEVSLELQQDSQEQTVTVDEMPDEETKRSVPEHPARAEAQHDAPAVFFPGSRFNQQPYGPGGYGNMGNPYGQSGFGGQDNGAVNFDFNCKCQAKSALAKSLLPVPADVNAAATQQIQQLQDQVRRMQEQINRAQAGKSSFESFAQMLAQADGLDCSCSGASAPFSNLSGGGNSNNNNNNNNNNGGRGNSIYGGPGGVGNPYGGGMVGGPYGGYGQFGGGNNGRFIPQNVYGGQGPYGNPIVYPGPLIKA